MPFRFDLQGDELHSKLGGAIPSSSFVMIEAPNAVGKSILAQRFAYGVLKHGHSVTYVSTELGLMGFIRQMSSLHYDIRQDLLSKRLKFVSLFSSIGVVNFEENLIRRLLEAKDLLASEIIIIDTLSEFLVRQDLGLSHCFTLLHDLRKIVGEERTVIFCIDPTSIGQKLLELLRSVSDVYMRMEVRDQFGTLVKILKVERFNGAPGEVTSEIPFKVKAGIGIVPELASSS